MSGNRVALVFCVHHKPWLVMSTILTTLLQDYSAIDFHFVYQMGDGSCPEKASYAEYRALSALHGVDPQLSPYDPRVRHVCQLRGRNVYEVEFENDSGLDSGAWYKFIRTGAWRRYDYVLFVGEGTLLTRPNTLSAMLNFCTRQVAHSITAGHEKRNLSKSLVLRYNSRSKATPMAEFHDRMIARVFDMFCRDPAFERLYAAWRSEGSAETQNHVSDIFTTDPFDSIRTAVSVRERAATVHHLVPRLRAAARAALYDIDRRRACRAVTEMASGPAAARLPSDPVIHLNGRRCRVRDVVAPIEEGGVRFHAVREPEWFGCAVNHLMSRELLERLWVKLETFALYDALDVPFAGTALEIVWGFVPAWLGYTKWFTDGMHRVRKHFVTARREDDPHTVASYLNRYHRGAVCVDARDVYLRLSAVSPAHDHMRSTLSQRYWQ